MRWHAPWNPLKPGPELALVLDALQLGLDVLLRDLQQAEHGMVGLLRDHIQDVAESLGATLAPGLVHASPKKHDPEMGQRAKEMRPSFNGWKEKKQDFRTRPRKLKRPHGTYDMEIYRLHHYKKLFLLSIALGIRFPPPSNF